MTRAVLYARFSSDLQRVQSIGDQHRALRDALPRLGMREIAVYGDAAIHGSTMARPGLEAAMAEIEAGRADVLLAEALDRISRDLEHVARIAKRVAFRGARIHTLSEGPIGALHIGLAGTMSQIYLEQLAEKTKRGLRGVVAEGRIAAGRAYGYRPTGAIGVFEIDAGEAGVVRRIFRDYAAGRSPIQIAHALNAEDVPAPRGAGWKGNTILGSRALGVGIVNNRLYAGEIVWNRQTWRKDPATGKRRPFLNPEAEWVIVAAPAMRIVDDSLWRQVRAKQGDMVKRGKVRRPTRPLTGLLVCGCCGARLSILGRDNYGCPVAKEQGPSRCSNGRRPRASEIERRVLDGLRANLCHPDVIETYSAAYVAEHKRLRSTAAAKHNCLTRALAEAGREQTAALDMMGKVPVAALDALAGRLGEIAERIEDLKSKLEAEPGADMVVSINHVSATHLAVNLERLWEQLTADEAASAEARVALASMITRIIVTPGEDRGAYALEIEGDVAAFLGLGCKKVLVAGARNERLLTRMAA